MPFGRCLPMFKLMVGTETPEIAIIAGFDAKAGQFTARVNTAPKRLGPISGKTKTDFAQAARVALDNAGIEQGADLVFVH